jgi:hypothetical protein
MRSTVGLFGLWTEQGGGETPGNLPGRGATARRLVKRHLYGGCTPTIAHCCVSGQIAKRQSSLILAMGSGSGGFYQVA